MAEPGALGLDGGLARGPALVSERSADAREGGVGGDDHAALAAGDLFVWIEPEDACAAERAGGLAFVPPAERLAAVFDHGDAEAVGDAGVEVHVGRVAEGLDGEDGPGAGCDGTLEQDGVHVERDRLDVDEDRRGTDRMYGVQGRDP